MTIRIHPSWHTVLAPEFEKSYWSELTSFVKSEYSQYICYPAGKDIFRAYDTTPFDQVKVVILGQDPYHSPGAAMGLSFSIPNPPNPLSQGGIKQKVQPSLRNIFKELDSDLGIKRTDTDLTDWAEQGILLLNSVLTVRKGEPASHQGKGWESFTDATIRTLSGQREGIVFILWGAYAIAKRSLIDPARHHIITSPHPSPFSADRGFFSSKPFSKTNIYLESIGKTPIAW